MHTATWLALQDELEKIADSRSWANEKTSNVLHDSVEGFMGALKAMPKGSAERGLHITKHMNHAPFVSALGKHPQGAQMKQMLNAHLNSPANAGMGGKKIVKVGSMGSHAAELAGLGILAGPSAAHLAGKEMSEKNKARAEVAGLGVLAAPSALAVGKKAVGKGKAILRAARVNKLRDAAMGVAKHASKLKLAAPSMGAMMNMHRLADAAKAAKGVAAPAAQAAAKLPNAAQQAGRAAHLGQHMAQGGHAFNPATRKTLSIPGLTD